MKKVDWIASFALGLVTLAPCHAQQVDISSGSVAETVSTLKPGEFVWAPEIAPDGPMLMIVNLKTQRALLYRNGLPIAATTVSTGRAGRETPTGIFTILQKHVVHHSSKYDNAPMPYMERLTWGGVALHAGHLPGYPASHGCIRMPAAFAKLLYSVTSLGMTVVVADTPTTPRVAPAPNIVSAVTSSSDQSGAFSWHPERALSGPVSVVISAADRRAIVLRNGTVIGSASVGVNGPVTGTWAYALRAIDADGHQQWVRLKLSGEAPADVPVQADEWQRFSAPPPFKKAVASIVEPGMTIVVTPDSLEPPAATTPVLRSAD